MCWKISIKNSESEENALPRPSKSSEILEKEKKSHRNKAEIESRKAAEAASLSGIKMREFPETKSDPAAHAEYRRVTRILAAVGKNDAIYESTINEYCTLKADILRYEELRKKLEEENLPADKRYNLLLDCDKQIDKYKRRRFEIEKENAMTIASSLRAIPKKPDTADSPLLAALRDD